MLAFRKHQVRVIPCLHLTTMPGGCNVIEELTAQGWHQKTSQAFAFFLPVKSVGVVGDARRCEYVIALRAVETVDFMTPMGPFALRNSGDRLQPDH
jgi:hypothetical protein